MRKNIVETWLWIQRKGRVCSTRRIIQDQDLPFWALSMSVGLLLENSGTNSFEGGIM